jgi:ribonucleoside-diphosphate reductase subunit M1
MYLALLYKLLYMLIGVQVSKGQLQYDMWGVTPTTLWDWPALKAQIAQYGVRNSLLVAPMPTASTAQVRGCFLNTLCS